LRAPRKARKDYFAMTKPLEMKIIVRLRRDLLRWYDASGRSLPWRIRPEERAAGRKADPYAVWLSEIMLQQTTVAHAKPYWDKFLAAFPTVIDLANAERDRVLAMWAGLGYYARARNLHKCAGVVRDEYGGIFPDTEAALLKLPGIGLYTAATMAAICFNEPTNIVDGNVERVIARLRRIETPLPKGKGDIRRAAGEIADPKRPGDYGQALMDLGASLCSPRNPSCAQCPWQWACAAHAADAQTDYPRKTPKAKLRVRYGAAFVLHSTGDETGDKPPAVLLRRRPDAGLLGGMMEVPGTPWGTRPECPLDAAPISRNWEKHSGFVKHIFTHFELRLDVYSATIMGRPALDGLWAEIDALEDFALPTVMKKVLAHRWRD